MRARLARLLCGFSAERTCENNSACAHGYTAPERFSRRPFDELAVEITQRALLARAWSDPDGSNAYDDAGLQPRMLLLL